MNMVIGQELCVRDISLKKQQLVQPWTGNISFRVEQQKKGHEAVPDGDIKLA